MSIYTLGLFRKEMKESRELAAKLVQHTTSEYNVDLIQQALDNARKQALEEAANLLETNIITRDHTGINGGNGLANCKHGDIGMTQTIFADAIRALANKRG